MLRSTPDTQHPRKWAEALRCEMQMAIGRRLRDEYGLPQELPPEPSARLIRKDKQYDPYADIVGTCGPAQTGTAGIYNRATYAKEMCEAPERGGDHAGAITKRDTARAQWQAPYVNSYYNQDTRNLRFGHANDRQFDPLAGTVLEGVAPY